MVFYDDCSQMFNVLVDSIKTSTEVQKNSAEVNQALMKNCNKMLEGVTNMIHVVTDKLCASSSNMKKSASKNAVHRGKRKVTVIIDGEEKEVCVSKKIHILMFHYYKI